MEVAGWTVIGDVGGGSEPLLLAEDASGVRGVLRALDVASEDVAEKVRDLITELDGLAGHPGIVRTLDLVEADGTWYLVTEPLPGLPLQALLEAKAHAARLGAWGGDEPTAAAVLIDAGLVCIALHGAGLVHGALGADTVVIDLDARARLRDPGLIPALTGVAPDPAEDARAFGALVRRVRRAWVPRGDRFGDALDRAAELAAPEVGTPDLDRAVDEIRRSAKSRLAGWEQRPRLVRAVTGWRSTQPLPVPVTAPPPPAPVAAAAAIGATVVDPPAIPAPAETVGATVVDPPAPPAAAATVADPPPAAAAPPSTVPRYRLGGTPAAEVEPPPPAAPTPPPPPPPPAPAAGPIRIGSPPVAMAAAAAGTAAAAPAWPVVTGRRRGRRVLGAIALVLVAALIALVLIVLLHGHAGESVVRILRVRVSTDTAHIGCGGQAVVSGVITTNGAEGEVRYRWSRSDGVPTDGAHTQGVPRGATSVPVSFALTVTGPGQLSEYITLQVLSPERLGPYTAAIDYSCAP